MVLREFVTGQMVTDLPTEKVAAQQREGTLSHFAGWRGLPGVENSALQLVH